MKNRRPLINDPSVSSKSELHALMCSFKNSEEVAVTRVLDVLLPAAEPTDTNPKRSFQTEGVKQQSDGGRRGADVPRASGMFN